MRLPITLAIVLAACASTPTHERFAVRGSVSGLDGATVTLLVDSQPAAALGDGAFELPAVLFGGSLYTLAIGGVSDLHACTFGPEPTSGTVTKDLTISITCVSADTRLAALDLSIGPVLEPVLPTTRMFSTAPVAASPIFGSGLSTTVTATTANPQAQLFIGGNSAVSGVPSFPIPLGVADNLIDVSISIPGGVGASVSIRVPGVPELRVAAATPVAGQRFGAAIATSTTTLVIGSPNDGDGAVVVFARVGATWQLQARLVPPSPCSACRFGEAVAIAEDDTRIVVGAPGETSGEGAAYVFTRTGTAWAQEARLAAATPQAAAALGTSVAIIEPSSVVAVGAPGQASGAGAVFVFARAATTWTATQALAATTPVAGDALGTSVAASGATIAAGAPGRSSGAGATLVFVASGPTFVPQAVLVATNARAGAHFGAAVALVGDHLVIGAPDESSADQTPTADTSLPGAGAAYWFERTTTWAPLSYLKSAAPLAGAAFGAALALRADPGAETRLVVGAPGDAGFFVDGGAVGPYLGQFRIGPQPIRIVDRQAAQRVGASVAIIGDYVVAGAPGDGAGAGAVFSF